MWDEVGELIPEKAERLPRDVRIPRANSLFSEL